MQKSLVLSPTLSEVESECDSSPSSSPPALSRSPPALSRSPPAPSLSPPAPSRSPPAPSRPPPVRSPTPSDIDESEVSHAYELDYDDFWLHDKSSSEEEKLVNDSSDDSSDEEFKSASKQQSGARIPPNPLPNPFPPTFNFLPPGHNFSDGRGFQEEHKTPVKLGLDVSKNTMEFCTDFLTGLPAKTLVTYLHTPESLIGALTSQKLAGNPVGAFKLAVKGCQKWADSEYMWLVASNLADPSNSKSLLRKGIDENPKSLFLWLCAFRDIVGKWSDDAKIGKWPDDAKIQRWVEGLRDIFLDDEALIYMKDIMFSSCCDNDARINFLARPGRMLVNVWLMYASIQSNYESQNSVLLRAKLKLPLDRAIFLASAALHERNGNFKLVRDDIGQCMFNLGSHGVLIDEKGWDEESEKAKEDGLGLTSKVIKDEIKFSKGVLAASWMECNDWKEARTEFLKLKKEAESRDRAEALKKKAESRDRAEAVRERLIKDFSRKEVAPRKVQLGRTSHIR